MKLRTKAIGEFRKNYTQEKLYFTKCIVNALRDTRTSSVLENQEEQFNEVMDILFWLEENAYSVPKMKKCFEAVYSLDDVLLTFSDKEIAKKIAKQIKKEKEIEEITKECPDSLAISTVKILFNHLDQLKFKKNITNKDLYEALSTLESCIDNANNYSDLEKYNAYIITDWFKDNYFFHENEIYQIFKKDYTLRELREYFSAEQIVKSILEYHEEKNIKAASLAALATE